MGVGTKILPAIYNFSHFEKSRFNEPSIVVDGDLAESIKRSASDRLGERCRRLEAKLFQGFSWHLASGHSSRNTLLMSYPGQPFSFLLF